MNKYPFDIQYRSHGYRFKSFQDVKNQAKRLGLASPFIQTSDAQSLLAAVKRLLDKEADETGEYIGHDL